MLLRNINYRVSKNLQKKYSGMTKPKRRKDDNRSPRDRFKDLAAQISEHFPDYVLIVRETGGMVFKFSDRAYAQGAMNRLLTRMDTEERDDV